MGINLLNWLVSLIQSDPIAFFGIGLVVMLFVVVVLPLYQTVGRK